MLRSAEMGAGPILTVSIDEACSVGHNSMAAAIRPDPLFSLRACPGCGLVHRLPELGQDERAVCSRCQMTIVRAGSPARSNQRTAAATLAALVLFVPAVTLPMLEVERLGHRYTSSLLGGTWDLLHHGSWFVGSIVLVFSLLLPLLKLVVLLELSWLGRAPRRRRARAYRWIESLGRWSMLDVLLLALMVMLVKVGDLVEFRLGPAALAFVLCVAMTMVASMSFDPRSIWEDEA